MFERPSIRLPTSRDLLVGLMPGVAKDGLASVVSILLADALDLDEIDEFIAGINLTMITLIFAF